ncbi:TraR/DksA family transcriptional regulator [Akkermansiaceae bacterium]|nr:TraR/DksA family transcriptional regulator [Akkermansiaceae bacterium]
MVPTIFTLTYAHFKSALWAIILIMVLGGWFRNLYAKKRIQAALKAVSSGPPDPDSNPQTGEVIAIEHFSSVLGLPGYLPPTQWQRFFGTGTEMELLFTQSALIFCDPSASESLKRTSIPFVDVISTRTDYNNGSNLIIKSKCGTIYCDTDRTLGAKPVKELLDTILRDQPIKASQKGPGQQEGFHGCVSPSNIIDPIEPHQTTAPPPLLDESQNFQIPAEPPHLHPKKLTKLTIFEKKQQQRLLELRDQITDMMYGIQNDTIHKDLKGGEASGVGIHHGDAGSDSYDRDFCLYMLSREADALGEIEQALQRLELGTYGFCEESGKEIPQARLEAIPFVRLNVDRQEANEVELLPPGTRKLHNSPPQPCSGIADQGRKEGGNINHLRKITKDSLHDDALLGISSDMPTEEISNHLNRLFRKYSGRISHDDPRIATEARGYLKRIGEARARYIGVY